MSRILIGSSNVYRHYRAAKFAKFPSYIMVRCVNLESFIAHVDSIDSEHTEVVVSVLENFVAKAGEIGDEDQRKRAIFSVIQEYLTTIETAAKKNPGTKFILVDPILRPKVEWYDTIVEIIRKEVREVISTSGLQNVSRCDVMPRASQQFEEDGVHLTDASGRIFVEGMLEAAEKIFGAQFIDLTVRDTPADTSLAERVRKLEVDTEERKWNDNLLFARTREELDTASNRTKEDRIEITGLSSSTPPPVDKDQKKAWLRDLVLETIKKVLPTFDGTLGFVNQGKSNGRDMPMVEVRLNSVEAASSIWKAFAEKRKEGDGKALGRLYMSNSVTLSTRVRVDVMKAIAKKITIGTESAYVAAYSSRPILHVRSQTGRGTEVINRAFTFIDSIIRFGSVLVRSDLDDAYRRAGTAFKGQLEQHFVVLKEWGATGGVRPPGRSGKRPRDETGESSSSTRTKFT